MECAGPIFACEGVELGRNWSEFLGADGLLHVQVVQNVDN